MIAEWHALNARVNALLAELDAPRSAGLRIIPAQDSRPNPARLSEERIAMLATAQAQKEPN